MLYHVDLWEERKMQFGIGTTRLQEFYATKEKIKELCFNSETMRNVKGINGIHVIKLLDGRYYLNQIRGYNGYIGAYCYMVHPDGHLEKAF